MKPLIEYKKNITSQNGDDGIIEEIFKRIGEGNKFCIEFGAWDGKYLSNVWNLWHNLGWKALLVEADKEKIKTLQENTRAFENVTAFQAYIKDKGEDSIGAIVEKLNMHKDVDLLSIDIDGDDYYIFKELDKITPRVIVIEYNPTIPPTIELIQKAGEYMGSSALSILKLGHKKSYKLAAITDTNLFFVIATEFDKLDIREIDLNIDFPTNHLVYVYSSFDGTTFINQEPPFAFKGMSVFREVLFNCIQANPILKKFIYKRLYISSVKYPEFESSIEKIPVRLYKDK